jgi:hypothetical protein
LPSFPRSTLSSPRTWWCLDLSEFPVACPAVRGPVPCLAPMQDPGRATARPTRRSLRRLSRAYPSIRLLKSYETGSAITESLRSPGLPCMGSMRVFSATRVLVKDHRGSMTSRSMTAFTPSVSRARATARRRSAVESTVPLSVTVEPSVDTSLDRVRRRAPECSWTALLYGASIAESRPGG